MGESVFALMGTIGILLDPLELGQTAVVDDLLEDLGDMLRFALAALAVATLDRIGRVAAVALLVAGDRVLLA